jgi:hypothetical protein
MRISLIIVASLASLSSAWVTPPAAARTVGRGRALAMAIDYNDPIVAEEFANVQMLTYEDVEEELLQTGIRSPPTMSEMDLKLMLVEVRLQYSGKLKPQTAKEKKTSFSSKFEEAMYSKPVFEEYYNKLKDKGDHNAMNVVSEFLNDPKMAEERYGKDYKAVFRQAKKALAAALPVKSCTVQFSGFPANMGEQGTRMTLEALGTIADFQCDTSEDMPILTGTVTFEDIETAKKAIEQYNGMDMGMGSQLEMVSV